MLHYKYRDVDSYPINLDDEVCQQVLHAAESLNYIEVCEGAASVIAGTSSQYDIDAETPDHMTSNSEPDIVQVTVKTRLGCFYHYYFLNSFYLRILQHFFVIPK